MEEGRLRYAGRVGSGMDAATRARLRATLDARSRPTHPFDVAPADLAATPGAAWAEPTLVIRAEIGGWSRDGIVRQAAFTHEAPEVDPSTVERQEAVGPEAAARALAKAGTRPRARAAGAGARGRARCRPAPVPRRAAARRARDRRRARARAGPDRAFERPTADELAALDALPARGGTWCVGGRDVALTNLAKVLAPGRPGEAGTPDESPITKRDLVRYYRPGRPRHAPPPRRARPQPRPLPGRHRRPVLLAEGCGDGDASPG